MLAYEGRRSGRRIVLPTQYARSGDDVVILVGKPETKRWWHNFEEPRDVDVLLAGEWQPMTGRAIRGAREPVAARPLLEAYLARFPRTVEILGEGTDDDRLTGAVLVRCRPR